MASASWPCAVAGRAALEVQGGGAGQLLFGRPHHLRQGGIRQHIGMRQPRIAPLQDFGKADAGQHLHGKDLLHARFKAQKAHGLSGLDVHHPHPTGALLEPLAPAECR